MDPNLVWPFQWSFVSYVLPIQVHLCCKYFLRYLFLMSYFPEFFISYGIWSDQYAMQIFICEVLLLLTICFVTYQFSHPQNNTHFLLLLNIFSFDVWIIFHFQILYKIYICHLSLSKHIVYKEKKIHSILNNALT